MIGDGVEQDYVEAFKWIKKGAEGGSIKAQFNLGRMYSKGEGVEQDYAEALNWYMKSAEHGNKEWYSAELMGDYVYDKFIITMSAETYKRFERMR